jgi:hypothetical protein
LRNCARSTGLPFFFDSSFVALRSCWIAWSRTAFSERCRVLGADAFCIRFLYLPAGEIHTSLCNKGRKLHEQIATAIRVYDKLLILLPEASLQSEW